jgi:single-stranded DNA-binding protein
MDLNLAVIAGSLSAPPEIRTFDSGARLARYLITVRSTEPRSRVDVLPVVDWDPDDEDAISTLDRGDRIWTVCSVQRRFWSAAEGRRSKIEIVAHHVEPLPLAIDAEVETTTK